MNWFHRLKSRASRKLCTDEGVAPVLGPTLARGFRQVYFMGPDGKHHPAPDIIGWMVGIGNENRCWQFEADAADPDSWPDLEGALFIAIPRPDQLICQLAVTLENECWWSDETLVLHPCGPDQLLSHLTVFPLEWEIVAKQLGLRTLTRWVR